NRRAEIEFQFSLAPTRVDALLALLHRHGLLTARQGFGMRRRLEGLMTGLIDLTYLFDGRWYVLDWKSNRLPGYGPAQLEEAMAHSEYHLQALIYTIALHRWLRFRLGEGYDYARDFGGARYVFCRGLGGSREDAKGGQGAADGAAAGAQPVPGVHAWRFEPELEHALDALLAGDSSGPAPTACCKRSPKPAPCAPSSTPWPRACAGWTRTPRMACWPPPPGPRWPSPPVTPASTPPNRSAWWKSPSTGQRPRPGAR